MKRLGSYLLRNPLNAAWVAFALALLSFAGLPTGWLSLVVVALVTLRLGFKQGVFVLFWAALPGVALAYLHHPGWLINVVLVHGSLLLVLSMVLRHYRSWRYVIETAVLIAMIAVVAIHSAVPNLHDWWLNHLQQSMHASGLVAELHLSAEKAKEFVATMANIATGVSAVSVVLMSLLTLFLARWWQAALFNPGGLRQEVYQIRIGHWLTIVLVLCIVGLIARWYLLIDLLPIAMLPFVAGGLSLLHMAVYHHKVKPILLWIVYILLLLIFPYVVSLIALFGFADSWFNFREKIVAK